MWVWGKFASVRKISNNFPPPLTAPKLKTQENLFPCGLLGNVRGSDTTKPRLFVRFSQTIGYRPKIRKCWLVESLSNHSFNSFHFRLCFSFFCRSRNTQTRLNPKCFCEKTKRRFRQLYVLISRWRFYRIFIIRHISDRDVCFVLFAVPSHLFRFSIVVTRGRSALTQQTLRRAFEGLKKLFSLVFRATVDDRKAHR